MDIIPFSTAMGMAAMMTGSGTGPRATSESFTMPGHLDGALLRVERRVDADDLDGLAGDAAGLR